MTISEFIEKLEKIKNEKEDLEIIIWDYRTSVYENAIFYLGIVDKKEVLVIDAED